MAARRSPKGGAAPAPVPKVVPRVKPDAAKPPPERKPDEGKGLLKDEVRLELVGPKGEVEKAILSQEYHVKLSVFTQPGAFNVKVGRGDDARDLVKKFPPRTPFRLYINECLQYEGWTDGYDLSVNTSGTSLNIHGRDILAPIHDGQILRDLSFEGLNASQLVDEAIRDVEMEASVTLDKSKAVKTRTGHALIAYEDPPFTAKQAKRLARAYVDETWYQFIKRHLDHSGLFLWAAPGKTLVISKPNKDAEPAFWLRRSLNEQDSTIIDSKFAIDTTKRYSDVYVYSKGSSVKRGRGGLMNFTGHAEDIEMQSLGFKKRKTIRDSNVTSAKEANLFASRKLAEANRHGHKISYTVVGHSGVRANGVGTAIWTPDTMVKVEDYHAGVFGKYWIESVEFRSPPTTTLLELVRWQDLIFGSDEQ